MHQAARPASRQTPLRRFLYRHLDGHDGRVSRREVAEYYDRMRLYYRLFWHPDALHYGFWEDGVRNLTAAVRRTDRFVGEALGIQPGHRVLDAGCGVGGTAVFLAEQFGARVTGITISRSQARIARRRAARSPHSGRLDFQCMDYSRTAFRDASFDHVLAIESITHDHAKAQFLREAHRLLAPGGGLAVADTFALQRPHTDDQRRHLKTFLAGWVTPDFATRDGFRADLEAAGFAKIRFHDKRIEIMPSLERIHRLGLLGSAVSFPLRLLPAFRRSYVFRHGMACIAQRDLYRDGLLGYGVFVARKRRS